TICSTCFWRATNCRATWTCHTSAHCWNDCVWLEPQLPLTLGNRDVFHFILSRFIFDLPLQQEGRAMNLSDTKATLSFSDGSPSLEMPIYKGTVGPDVIDIRKLYGNTGKFTYDPGFMSTAACNSSITYIDGDKG